MGGAVASRPRKALEAPTAPRRRTATAGQCRQSARSCRLGERTCPTRRTPPGNATRLPAAFRTRAYPADHIPACRRAWRCACARSLPARVRPAGRVERPGSTQVACCHGQAGISIAPIPLLHGAHSNLRKLIGSTARHACRGGGARDLGLRQVQPPPLRGPQSRRQASRPGQAGCAARAPARVAVPWAANRSLSEHAQRICESGR